MSFQRRDGTLRHCYVRCSNNVNNKQMARHRKRRAPPLKRKRTDIPGYSSEFETADALGVSLRVRARASWLS
jgi:hypothetical protein